MRYSTRMQKCTQSAQAKAKNLPVKDQFNAWVTHQNSATAIVNSFDNNQRKLQSWGRESEEERCLSPRGMDWRSGLWKHIADVKSKKRDVEICCHVKKRQDQWQRNGLN